MADQTAPGTLSSLRNALRVLECFSVDDPEKGVTEIAQELGLGKSTVHRVLITLEQAGYVRKDEATRHYRLGLSVLRLSGVLISNLELYREGQHLLEVFANRFDEAVHLAVLEGYHTVYISKIESSHPVRILTHLGRKNPIHCTSSGKVILAFQTPALIDTVVDLGLERFTRTTVTDPVQFRTELAEIRNLGCATSHGEMREGVSSIAVPVRDYSRQVVGAVTVVGPTGRFTPTKVQSLTKQLHSVGREISARLGYRARER